MADRVGQPGLRRGDQLQVELGQVRLRPAHLRQPLGHPLLAGRVSAVHLAVGALAARPSARRDEAGLLQPAERDVDLARR